MAHRIRIVQPASSSGRWGFSTRLGMVGAAVGVLVPPPLPLRPASMLHNALHHSFWRNNLFGRRYEQDDIHTDMCPTPLLEDGETAPRIILMMVLLMMMLALLVGRIIIRRRRGQSSPPRRPQYAPYQHHHDKQEHVVTIYPVGLQLDAGRGLVPRDALVDCVVQERVYVHRVATAVQLQCQNGIHNHPSNSITSVDLFPNVDLSYRECQEIVHRIKDILGLPPHVDNKE